jgi:hypothetical protein
VVDDEKATKNLLEKAGAKGERPDTEKKTTLN